MSKTKEEILNSHLAYGKDTYLAGSEEAILKAMDAWAEQRLKEYKERIRSRISEYAAVDLSEYGKGYVAGLKYARDL